MHTPYGLEEESVIGHRKTRGADMVNPAKLPSTQTTTIAAKTIPPAGPNRTDPT